MSSILSAGGSEQAADPTFYEPIDSFESEIRLIELDQSGPDTKWKLSTVSLKQNPAFTALSYLWGDPHITENITLNDRNFAVTTNLAAALGYVHHHWATQFPSRDSKSFRLWVDAICINQHDVAERNAQVPLMHAIYSSAELVISWLGPLDATICLAIDTIKLLAQKLQDVVDDDLTFSWMKDDPSLYEADCGPQYAPIRSNRRANSLDNLSELSYWKRVWILQEVTLARNLILICGPGCVDGGKIQYLSNRFFRFQQLVNNNNTPKPESFALSVWVMITQRVTAEWALFFKKVQEVRDLELKSQDMQNILGWDLLSHGALFCATDPRDHIYGLLGLAKLDIGLAYDQPVPVVYSDYVHHWLEFWRRWAYKMDERSELFFLSYSGDGMYANEYQLPSWAPNYPTISIPDSTPDPFQYGSACLSVFGSDIESARVCGPELWVSGSKLDTVDGIVEKATDDQSKIFLQNFNFAIGFGLRSTDRISILQTLVRLYGYRRENIRSQIGSADLVFAKWAWCFIIYLFSNNPKALLPKVDLASIGFELSSIEVFVKSFEEIFQASPDKIGSIELRAVFEQFKREAFTYLEDLNDLLIAIITSRHYAFIHTQEGNIGFAPPNTKIGDTLWVFKGSKVPSVLRKHKSGQYYVHVGTCHVDGFMNGEAKEYLTSGRSKVERIVLK